MTRAVSKTNLPIPPPLLARVPEASALAAAFDGGARLVTLLGPGGIGKTHLALHYARTQVDVYASNGGGGAWFVDLTGVTDAEGLTAAVGEVLGRERRTNVGAALARRGHTLVLLDNAEHVALLAGELLSSWLGAAPSIRFLLTSRVALGVRAEHVVRLEGLPVPPLHGDDAALRDSPAVALFAERALRTGAAPLRTEGEFAAVAEIVRRLDGVPLAIELVAARTTALTPHELLARMTLALVGRDDDDGRHGSMERVIDESFASLPTDLQSFYVATAVFRGGFFVADAERIIDHPDVLGAVTELVRRSLLRVVETTHEHGRRFAHYEAIREHAGRRLAADPRRASLMRRHKTAFVERARALAERMETGERDAEERVAVDSENMLLAYESADARERIALALALEPTLLRTGRIDAAARLFDGELSSAAAQDDGLALSLAEGRVRAERGDMRGATAVLEAAQMRFQEASDPVRRGQLLGKLGELVELRGETRAARALFDEALSLLTASAATPSLRSELAEAEVRTDRAHALRREGDLDAAELDLRRAMAIYRAARRDERLATTLYELGVLGLFRGDPSALGRFDEGLALARARGAPAVEAALTTARGTLLQEQGDLEVALSLHAHAAALYRNAGHRYGEVSTLYYLAGAYFERGDAAEAASIVMRALPAARELGIPRYVALYEGLYAIALASDAMFRDVAGAKAALERGDAAAAACATETSLSATLAIHRLHVEAIERHDSTDEAIARARALAKSHANDDPRFALRALMVGGDRPAGTRTAGATPRAKLVVRDGGSTLDVRHGDGSRAVLDLSRRAPLRAIAHFLVERRKTDPGQGCTLDELVAAAWPDERMSPASASNRVYVAIATLRKGGLKELLESGEGGYAIAPTVTVSAE